MERLFNMIIEALEDPKVSKEDILNWMYSERHIQEVCEDDGDNYELGSFFDSEFYHGPRPELNWEEDDDHDYYMYMDEEDFISNELPTHTLGKILMFHETYGK